MPPNQLGAFRAPNASRPGVLGGPAECSMRPAQGGRCRLTTIKQFRKPGGTIRSPPRDQQRTAWLARAANGLRFSGGAMPRSLIILRFLTATARCPSNAPAACSTVPGRCKRLLAAGRNDILGCDDAAGRCGVPTPGGPAAPSELRRGGRSLDACPPGTTLTLPRPPRGRGPGRHGGACQTTRARRPVPPHLRQPAEELRRHHQEPTKRSALGGPAGACS